MRPLFAIVLAIAILGTVKGYMVFQQAASAPARIGAPTVEIKKTNYQIRATLNFDAVSDPFQLYPASLEIRQLGEDEPVLRHPDPIAAGIAIESDVLLRQGMNDLRIEAHLETEPTVDNGSPQKTTPTLDLEVLDGERSLAKSTVPLTQVPHGLTGRIEVTIP